jgi:hypothetical protein
VYIISITDGAVADPTHQFAGRSAAAAAAADTGGSNSSTAPEPLPRGLLGPQLVPLNPSNTPKPYLGSGTGGPGVHTAGVTGGPGPLGDAGVTSGPGNRSVSWWGPRVLAVAGSDGSVSLARLPGSVNILGAAPAKFAPGAANFTIEFNMADPWSCMLLDR